MKYAPGKVPANPLPAAPARPVVKPTVTGAPATPMTPKPGGPPPMGPSTGIPRTMGPSPMTGGPMPRMKKGGKVSSASKRADGCCIRGKTRA